MRVFGVVPGDAAQRDGCVFHGAGNGSNGVHGPYSPHHPVPANPSQLGSKAHQSAQSGWKRMDPPVSSPSDVAHMKAAVAAPEPLLEPRCKHLGPMACEVC